MFELILLGVFASMLLICVLINISILVPLVLGFIIFYSYGIYKKHTPKEMLKMAFSGVTTVRNILLIFILIGILTGTWRASGTIAYIVYYAIQICSPSVMVLISFILTSVVSFLTGTAFGAAATVGTICMAISNSLGIAPMVDCQYCPAFISRSTYFKYSCGLLFVLGTVMEFGCGGFNT